MSGGRRGGEYDQVEGEPESFLKRRKREEREFGERPNSWKRPSLSFPLFFDFEEEEEDEGEEDEREE